MTEQKRALIFGVTGMVGRNIAERLAAEGGWAVVGTSRGSNPGVPGVEPVACDLLDADGTRDALSSAGAVTHAFFATWQRCANEEENCVVNGAMIRNALAAIPGDALQHVALVTGLKHYLGSFEDFAKRPIETPLVETLPRLPGANFYYVHEDALFDSARTRGHSWSVARPHTIIGYAPGNAMNLGTAVAVYASLCKATGRPFVFPGSPTQHDGLTDVSDARQVAAHMIWSSTDPKAADTAFNVTNGDIFRWRRMWLHIADWFGLEVSPYPGRMQPMVEMMADAGDSWRTLAAEHGLVQPDIAALAPWWHVDADLGRDIEVFCDMGLSRERGFSGHIRTPASFSDLFTRLRKERLIP
ncbi:MAG: SDR family oxidoreductase [Alphaproteobacteria bacterium]